jgi:N-sulfoglucosamine sulfohydrolase
MGLAKKGVTFRHAFCGASSCSAARSVLLTGMYPHQNGMTGLGHRGWYLNDYQKTLVPVLKRAGYHTALMGESHVAPRGETELLGFDEVLIENSTPTEEMVGIAEAWFAKMPREPWFLSCGFWDTHRTSYREPDPEHTKYGAVMPPFPDKPELREDFAAFRGAVERLDGGIGKVLEALRASGQADNTIIIATTDHAPGFPLYKATVSDKGLGVFVVMSGPGIRQGTVYESMVGHIDIFPTICDLIGIDHPDWLEGKSWLPILKDGRMEPLHEAVFGESNYHAAYEPQRSIRTARYRYFERYDGRTEPVVPNTDEGPTKAFWLSTKPRLYPKYLYDLDIDPNEKQNLAGAPAYTDIEKDLARQLEDWRQQTDDPLLKGDLPLPSTAEANDPDQANSELPTHHVGKNN